MFKRKRSLYPPGSRRVKRRPLRSRQSTTTKLVRELLGNQEHKYLDTYVNYTDAVQSVVCFNKIAEGSDFNQRIGRKVKGLYIQYDIYWNNVLGNSQTYNPIHWSWHIVQDRQSNGSTASYGTVFDLSVIASGPGAFKNIASGHERFNILKDEVGFIGGSTYGSATTVPAVSVSSENSHCRGYIPFKEIIQYGGSSAVEPITNALYLTFANDETTTNNGQVTYCLRFVYHDV